jgi:hypothetical protein
VSSKKSFAALQSRLANIDWTLLMFLLLFLNVKLAIKATALIIVFIIRPGFKFGLTAKNSRLPSFYIIIIGIALLNYFLYTGFKNLNYTIAAATGILFWIMCLLAAHQVKLSVEKNKPEILHNTILVFLLINAAASLTVYAGIMLETGTINPYRYQGNYQKYFIGTGDYIKGISFDTSTTNAVLNAFAVIYFLLRNKNTWCLFFMAVLLLTGSNITNILLCLVLLYVFIFQSSKNQKSIVITCMALLVVFLAKISPQNNNYITAALEKFSNTPGDKVASKQLSLKEKPDSILSRDEKKQKIAIAYLDSIHTAMKETGVSSIQQAAVTAVMLKEKPQIPQPNIHTPPFQHKDDTTVFKKELLQFIKEDTVNLSAVSQFNLPGKVIALLQTFHFLKLQPVKILTGSGIGNFSSKLAFKTTALKIAGGYPEKYKYINRNFETNHLALYLGYFTKTAGLHSLINTPNSVYDQLLGEYGAAGIAALLFGYIGFFWQKKKKLTYGFPILLLLLGLFFVEYWFEQLSVIVFFELLLFLNIKENTIAQTA